MRYRCNNCGFKFDEPLHHAEKHGIGYGPYEIIAICPACRVADIEKVEEDNELPETEE